MVDFRNGMGSHFLEDFNAFLGVQEVRKWEGEFLPDEQVKKKYEASLGYKL
jgi:hypothetical protein